VIKRPFFALAGLGLGITMGIWTVRRFDQARHAMAPQQVASRAGAQAGALGQRLAEAVAVGREAAAARESELRAVYRVRPAPDPTVPGPTEPEPTEPEPTDSTNR
jgi:hypothetical protein